MKPREFYRNDSKDNELTYDWNSGEASTAELV